jgi:hypothetical protein
VTKPSLRERQRWLKSSGEDIEAGVTLEPAERQFIGRALQQIAAGADPYEALNIKPRRGERRRWTARENQKREAMGWIAIARLPKSEGGLGLTLEAACALLAELKTFPFTEESLRTFANKSAALRDPIFTLD